MNHNRYGVLITGDPSDSTRDIYGSYGDLFVKLLRRKGEIWDFFDTRLGEYPEDIKPYKAFVITGSASTAHEDVPWIESLKQFISKLHDAGTRILGVCFGHQALAGALGGVTDVNTEGWEIGLHQLEWSTAAKERADANGALLPGSVLEIHRDHVVKLPPGAEVLASTGNTHVQVFRLGDAVLGVQGHPEFFNDIVEDLVIKRRDAGIIDHARAEKALVSLKNEPPRDAWISWLQSFLDET